jgi:hypothetical protein
MVFVEAPTTAGWPSRPALSPSPFLLFSVLINWLAHTHTPVCHMLLCRDGVIPSCNIHNRLQVSIYESLFLSAILFLSYIQLCVWSSMNKISNTSNLTKQQHPEIVICMSHNEIIMKIGTCPSQFFIHLFNMTSHGCFVCMHFPPATYNLSF